MTDQELNEAVARKLGWIEKKYDWGIKWARDSDVQCSDDMEDRAPDYCHSIEAAWEIVEWMQEKYPTEEGNGLLLWRNGDKIICELNPNLEIVRGVASSAPMAICLAFLKLP